MGIPMIYFIGACGMLGIVFGMHNYISIYGHEPIVKADTSKSSKKGAGIMEGEKPAWTKPGEERMPRRARRAIRQNYATRNATSG